jgi:cold shock CspA family protein
VYGVISTIKQGFGFIQPLSQEEQIYFGGRELSPDMKLGDLVGFVTRDSPRGLAAENVRVLSGRLDPVVAAVKGSLSRSPDRHRSNYGTIALELPSAEDKCGGVLEGAGVKEVYFLPAEVVPKSVPKGHRLDKGDYVEFAVQRVIGSNLFVATTVSFLQLKRERAVSQQIQRMQDAGVAREQGVVSTLKRGEYGFIKPLDRKDEVYFRLGDGAAAGAEAASEEKLAEVAKECAAPRFRIHAVVVCGVCRETRWSSSLSPSA